jgi:hypothetical protein
VRERERLRERERERDWEREGERDAGKEGEGKAGGDREYASTWRTTQRRIKASWRDR